MSSSYLPPAQQMSVQDPCIDIQNNPFYCPAIPANKFISSLRRKCDKFRAKAHTYGSKRIVLDSFSSALERCLFRDGEDSDDDKRTSQYYTESRRDSSGDGIDALGNSIDAHISTMNGLNKARRGLAGARNSLLCAGPYLTAGDSLDFDSFATVPLAPTASRRTNEKDFVRSGFTTLNDNFGRPLVTTSRIHSLAPHALSLWDKLSMGHILDRKPFANLKRKSSESDSSEDFDSSKHTKRAKSNLSVSDTSFYVTVRREKLRFLPTSQSTLSSQCETFSPERPGTNVPADFLRAGTHITVPRSNKWTGPLENVQDVGNDDLRELFGALQDELFGPRLDPETDMQKLVEKLDTMFPGIRIKARLNERLKCSASHQTIVDFLAESGHLNANTLELFRASQIASISLSESFNDYNGLNLVSDESFFVFSKPNSYRSLTTLFLDGLCLKIPTLSHLQHLPKLTNLSLFDTGIINEALFHLVPLKYTLTRLNVARNPSIDDDAVPALLKMTKLAYLSIAETSIQMPGARKFVTDLISSGQYIVVDFPHWCHDYVATMESKYLVEIPPPLVSNPLLCSRLSAAALKRNLAAHAAVNRDVSTGGAKKDMVERLKGLLEMRLADLEVRRLIRGTSQREK
ncbi:hypothetical protein APHAL10511_000832 [Amanita phalloides]|nr:hypothetical protein APHAL10511_000832 [Amanita phalloides]